MPPGAKNGRILTRCSTRDASRAREPADQIVLALSSVSSPPQPGRFFFTVCQTPRSSDSWGTHTHTHCTLDYDIILAGDVSSPPRCRRRRRRSPGAPGRRPREALLETSTRPRKCASAARSSSPASSSPGAEDCLLHGEFSLSLVVSRDLVSSGCWAARGRDKIRERLSLEVRARPPRMGLMEPLRRCGR